MKTITIYWHTEDVLALAKEINIELTEQEADKIMGDIERYQDASIGINWDVIRTHIWEFENERQYKRKKELSKYPFNEGDDYWTIYEGEVTWSCWDEVSKELHVQNPNEIYFTTEQDAHNYLKQLN
jgi:hypothetical protein